MNPALAARLAEGVLRHMGQDAIFRGTIATRASIEHGVETMGFEGGQAFLKSVVTLPKALNPKAGDTLVVGALTSGSFMPAASYIIDGPAVHDNGSLVRHTVRAAPP